MYNTFMAIEFCVQGLQTSIFVGSHIAFVSIQYVGMVFCRLLSFWLAHSVRTVTISRESMST